MERNSSYGSSSEKSKSGGEFLTLETMVKHLAGEDRNIPVMFANGEPTLNSQLPTLVKKAREMSFKKICIVTNARRLSYLNYASELVKSGMTEFVVSLHGSNARVHQSMTRTPGSFEQTWKGLQNLVLLKKMEPKLKIAVAIAITKLNLQDLYALLLKLNALEGIDYININTLSFQGNALRYVDKVIVSYSEVARECKRFEAAPPQKGINKKTPGICGSPFCAGKGLARMMESGVLMDIRRFERSDKIHGEHIVVKLAGCKKCIFFDKCQGIQPVYLDYFGNKEFQPVLAAQT